MAEKIAVLKVYTGNGSKFREHLREIQTKNIAQVRYSPNGKTAFVDWGNPGEFPQRLEIPEDFQEIEGTLSGKKFLPKGYRGDIYNLPENETLVLKDD